MTSYLTARMLESSPACQVACGRALARAWAPRGNASITRTIGDVWAWRPRVIMSNAIQACRARLRPPAKRRNTRVATLPDQAAAHQISSATGFLNPPESTR